MKAAIFSLGSKSSEMVALAMQKYFQKVDHISLKDIQVVLGKESGIYIQDKKIEDYDCVYLKGSFRYANLLRSLASLLEEKVPYMPLAASSFTTIHNKLLTHLALQKHNIPMPKTWVSANVTAAKDLLKKMNYPIVMKLPEGTQGKGVMFADSFSSASSMLDALGVLNQPFIIQEYIETGGADIRALVVGNKVVAAMRRKAQKEEKRANIHAGGTGEKIKISSQVLSLAVDTSKVLKAEVCGIDILESSEGPLVIEANISPGLQGLSKVVQDVNIPDEIAKYFFQRTEEAIKAKNSKREVESIQEILFKEGDENITHEIVSKLQFRGEKIILPEWVTKLTGFSERNEFLIKAEKDKLRIKLLKM